MHKSCCWIRVRLPLPTLFASPPVADMAMVIAQDQALKVDQEGIERMKADLEELSGAQVQHLLTDEREPSAPHDSGP